MQDMKTRMRNIVGKYNRSGNGSDMRVMDDDSNIEDLDEQTTTPKRNEVSQQSCEPFVDIICKLINYLFTYFFIIPKSNEKTFGCFNSQRALAQAQRLGDDDLISMNGDDRRNFLRSQPSSLLYLWHILKTQEPVFQTYYKFLIK